MASLRGQLFRARGILSETYSYLTFRDRFITDNRFLEEVLNYAGANGARIRRRPRMPTNNPSLAGGFHCEVETFGGEDRILMGDTEEDVNSYSGHVMLRRLNVRKPEKMWNAASFENTDQERVPAAYYLPPTLAAAIERLKAHGIRMEQLTQTTEMLQLDEFQIESIVTTPQSFENHKERTVTGSYAPVERSFPAGAYRVSMDQPLARLAFYLLEPRSNDGLLTWNFLDDAIKDGKTYPILRTCS